MRTYTSITVECKTVETIEFKLVVYIECHPFEVELKFHFREVRSTLAVYAVVLESKFSKTGTNTKNVQNSRQVRKQK